MTTLIVVFALVFVGLSVLIAAATRSGQGYFYETIVDGLTWRSVVVAGIITAFLGLWVAIESKSPGRFDSLFNLGARDTKPLDQFWSERQGPSGPTLVQFRRKINTAASGDDYFDDSGRRWNPSSSGIVTAIVVEEGGECRRFAVKLGPDGKFLKDPLTGVQYIEENGTRVMTETTIGQLSTTRFGAVALNILFNILFWLIWAACLCLILEFQWPHALLLGFIFWLASVTLLWPAIQGNVTKLG